MAVGFSGSTTPVGGNAGDQGLEFGDYFVCLIWFPLACSDPVAADTASLGGLFFERGQTRSILQGPWIPPPQPECS